MTKYFTLILCLILSLFLINQTNATVWYVHPDSSLNTIQAGLDSASAGDTVLVAPGTYYETIVWPSTPGIDLISEFGPEVTVINANGAGRVITMAQYLTPATLIDGFTIINGWATGTSPDDYGGGIYCLNTSPTIRNNIIRDNYGYSRGGGIYAETCNPHIIANMIHDNATSGSGGGIGCNNEAEAFILENNFYNNGAEHGGAIDCSYKCDPIIQYNQIFNNTASYGAGLRCGYGGYYTHYCSRPPTHYNNFSGNEAWGIYSTNHYSVPAQNNWWGHPAGPDSGDGVSGPTTYDPWLTEEIVFDIEAMSIEAPPDTVIPGGVYSPKIIVRNNCNYNYPVSFFTARCTINDYEDYVRINLPIPQDSTMEVTFADWVVPLEDSSTYVMSVNLSYAVDQVVTNGTISKQIIAQEPTGIDDTEVPSSPLSFTLSQNYPNPFNPTTIIHYQLPTASLVELAIWNALGQKIRTLVYESQIAGNHSATWDGRDDQGVSVASGLYFYRLKAGAYKETRKMLLVQ